MISPLRLAELAAEAYTDPASWQTDRCHACVTQIDGVSIVAFRGTNPESLTDWLCDLEAAPRIHPKLGICHSGFLRDVLGVADRIMADLAGQPMYCVGHSKGAAEALLFAGLLVAAGAPPIGITTFGSPRPAGPYLGSLLKGIAGSDYRNGDDPVTLVPIGYDHPRKLVQLGRTFGDLDVIGDHFMGAYSAALRKAEAQTKSPAVLAGLAEGEGAT